MDSVASVPIKRERDGEELQPNDKSTNMSNQPTSMTNHLKDNRSTQQANLFVSYSTRDQLISCLNLVSIILESNEPIPEDAKNRTCKKIEESIVSLMKLLPFKPTASVDQSAKFEERIAANLTFELLFEDQTSLINHLLTNQNAVLFSDKIIDESRSDLITANKRMIVQLIEAPSGEPMAGGAKSASKDKNTGEPPSKEQRVEYEISALGEGLNQLKNQIANLKHTVNSLKTELKEFRSELTLQIKSMDITCPETSFSFEVDGLSKFFQTDGNRLCSDKFWCAGLQWYIGVESDHGNTPKTPKEGLKVLAFYLVCQNDDQTEWSCEVNFKCTIFSKFPGKNFTRMVSHTFRKTRRDHRSFLNYRELTDKKNGFVQNEDKIILGVEMKAGPVRSG